MRIFDNCHGNQFGSDGGPGPIFRPLFNLLSGLFHHGPQFVYKGSFGRQLHVNAMVITICRDQLLNKELRKDAVAAGSPSGVLSRRHGIRQSVWSLLRMIASRGTLFGRVSKLKLNTDEGSKEFLVPDRNLAQETVDYWDGHGFHWGVKTPSDYDSLR